MKIENTNKVDEYPDNYDDLPQDKRKAILDYMNDQQAMADDYYEKHIVYSDMREEYLQLYNHVVDLLCGAKNVLSMVGIKVEYNWPSGKGWILATKKDAEAYNEWNGIDCSCNRNVEKYAGWPKPKGDRKW